MGDHNTVDPEIVKWLGLKIQRDIENQYLNVTTTTSQTPPLTVEVIKEAIQMLKIHDARLFGPETIFVFSPHTQSLLPVDLTLLRTWIIWRVKLNGEWHDLEAGEILAVHEDRMWELTNNDPYWVKLFVLKHASRKHWMYNDEKTSGDDHG